LAAVRGESRDGELSDDALMALYRTGDADAFDVLFDRHHASVYHFARAMLADPPAAEEVLQETFLAVARAHRRYERRGHFRTWLLRIVRNRCLNRLAGRRVRHAVSGQVSIEMADPPAPGPSPDRQVELGEDVAAVRAAIAQLPQRQREAIVLYAVDGMRYREIAGVLETPVNTVKTLIHRARAALAVALEDTWEDHTDGR